MTPAEAKIALQFHAFTHPEFEHERACNGFPGSLRPYRGQLNEGGFHISAEDVETLDHWVHCIQYAITNILDGSSEDVAFEAYREYCEDSREA